MMRITTFHIEPENEEFIAELTKHKELSKILNFLIKQYATDKGYMPPEKKIALLEAQLKKKQEQYDLIQKEMSK